MQNHQNEGVQQWGNDGCTALQDMRWQQIWPQNNVLVELNLNILRFLNGGQSCLGRRVVYDMNF